MFGGTCVTLGGVQGLGGVRDCVLGGLSFRVSRVLARPSDFCNWDLVFRLFRLWYLGRL